MFLKIGGEVILYDGGEGVFFIIIRFGCVEV